MTLATSTSAVLRFLAAPSDVQTLKMAHELAAVVAETGSARKAQKHLQDAINAKGLVDADGRPLKALTHKRIGFYVAAVEAFPTDAAAFRADYRARAAADRGATAKPADDTAVPQGNDATDDTSSRGGSVPQGNDTVTLADAIRELYVLAEAFGDQDAFRAALADVLDLTAPILLVSTPVAA